MFLSREQVAAILDATGPHRFLILLAVLTGARRGELGGLRWSDFKFDEGQCGVVHFQRSWGRSTTKGGKERKVPLHPALLPELQVAWQAATSELVFPAPRRGGMRSEAWHVAKLLRNIAKRAHVSLPSGITFHTLRKPFVTHLIRDTGGDITTAQQLAGHSTPTVTMTYYVGRDAAHHASQIADLQVASASATGHTPVTRKRRPMVATTPTSVKADGYASELPRRMPSDFIFL
ncbi:site-specific integrase [Myxococcaceae bacterium JPH2]|nr:site-specific integrase [Myxococcaceae bacterium JPH2]